MKTANGAVMESTMSASPRVPYFRLANEAIKGLLATSKAVHDSSIDPTLMELVFLRVSQINGCGYCMDMHGTALRKGGIEPRKLDTLPAWHESRFFDARERAALGWAEALTRLPDGAPADAAFDALAPHFDEKGISDLSVGVAVINAWNRLGAGLLPPLP
jgi:AhpD family alkylhydroperoxidase